ncbi:MAG: hypothetical protein OXQ86_08920 [Gammaproteobacteria bacterium]|nr:hypothetical protein [Gammaproteobacteria bacterium]MDE0414019.1 hypothetical protein [Gammaproteobacteria bacterium]
MTIATRPAQIVGNIGLYHACYKLSVHNWNVMPTSRNARGVDIICFSLDGARMLSMQVKTLSKSTAVPMGTNLDKIMGDFWIIVAGIALPDGPITYILLPHEVRALTVQAKTGSYWLQHKHYATDAFKEAWGRIGSGH